MVTGAVRVSSSVRLHVLVGACSIVLSRLFNSAFSGSDYMTPSDRVINNSNFDIIWKKNVLAWRNGGKLEKLPRQPFSGLSSESRNFECDTRGQSHETGGKL